MRTPTTLLPLVLLPFLTACEGALGGDIGVPRAVADADADILAGSDAGGGAPADRGERRPARPARPERTEPDEPAGDGVAAGGEDQAAGADPAPAAGDEAAPPSTPKPAAGGRRGGRGGGRSAGEVAVAVVEAGSGEGVATVRGVTLFAGDPPARAPIPQAATTPGCHEHGEVLVEDVVVADGKLANVFVSIRRVPDGVAIPSPPAEPFVMDQVGCSYVPHVGAVQVGREIQARNSDPIAHNVHVYANKNVGPNDTIQSGGKDITIDLPKPEKVRLACDIHPWMGAELYIVEHPWFAVSAADGGFTIADLPAGEYELEAEHAKLGKARSKPFTVGGGGQVEATFTFSDR